VRACLLLCVHVPSGFLLLDRWWLSPLAYLAFARWLVIAHFNFRSVHSLESQPCFPRLFTLSLSSFLHMPGARFILER
jgi:hypothetical protein